MSDSPQGSDWWLASDGKWYPPQTSPPPAGPLPPGYPPAQYAPPRTGETNGKAIAAMVLGIVSFVLCYIGWIAAIVGLILGLNARREINESGGTQSSRGMATAGIILSIVNIALYAVVLVIVILVIAFGGDSSSSGY